MFFPNCILAPFFPDLFNIPANIYVLPQLLAQSRHVGGIILGAFSEQQVPGCAYRQKQFVPWF